MLADDSLFQGHPFTRGRIAPTSVALFSWHPRGVKYVLASFLGKLWEGSIDGQCHGFLPISPGGRSSSPWREKSPESPERGDNWTAPCRLGPSCLHTYKPAHWVPPLHVSLVPAPSTSSNVGWSRGKNPTSLVIHLLPSKQEPQDGNRPRRVPS